MGGAESEIKSTIFSIVTRIDVLNFIMKGPMTPTVTPMGSAA